MFLGLLATVIPAASYAQAALSASLPLVQSASSTQTAQHKPITASGFVKSGPIVFEDVSEKAGLTHWTHKMGTPAKSYLVETKGSGVGLID